jgi:alpha-L-fucosidase
MLLNVGPNAKGEIPDESIKILTEIGEWMKRNGESIYNCGISALPKPDYGYITQNGKKVYIHVMENTVGPVPVKGITKDDVKRVRLVASGAELKTPSGWILENFKDMLFVAISGGEYGSYTRQDAVDTVVMVELK